MRTNRDGSGAALYAVGRMARPIKRGLEYFPLDVDFFDDDKVGLINSEFQEIGELVLLRLFCKIYKNGYFYKWGNDECLLFCRWAGNIFAPGQVNEVINGCLRRCIFDDGVFKAFNVLTSQGIQKRFLRAVAERKEVEIIREYWLIDLPDESKSTKYIVISGLSDSRAQEGFNQVTGRDNGRITGVFMPDNAESIEKDSKKKKSNAKTFAPDSIEFKSSKYLASEILGRNPNARMVPVSDEELYKWCVHVDYLLRIDKRPAEEFKEVLFFAVSDPFWSTVILSTEKLRDKYDQLYMQMCRGKEAYGGAGKRDFSKLEKRGGERFSRLRRKDAGTGGQL